MSHVHIAPKDTGGYVVDVDGHDLGTMTTAVAVSIGTDLRPVVSLTLRPRTLTADLPDAVLEEGETNV